jgi:hypothetical protein
MGMAPEARPVPFITENTPRVGFSALPWRSAVLEAEFLFQPLLFSLGQTAGRCDLLAMGRVLDSLVIRIMVWGAGSAMLPFLQ